MTSLQTQFRAALLDPSLTAPAGLVDPQGRPAGRRFDVYRNTVAVSLTEALAQGFPILRKLVGPENFRILAGAYLRQHPPHSPVLAFYGRDMPGFLASFAPTVSLPYLPDMARLELALRTSYHAADSDLADLSPLSGDDPVRIMNQRFTLAPSLQLVRSDWPIHAIWWRNTDPNAPAVTMAAQDVLITRPEFDPAPHLLPPGGGAFVQALASGQSLGDALEATGQPEFDLTTTLGLLISGNAITSLSSEPIPC